MDLSKVSLAIYPVACLANDNNTGLLSVVSSPSLVDHTE